MQSIIILLVSAIQLLNLVSANPQLPADFKANALKIAISAVQTAQDSITDNSLASSTVTVQVTSNNDTVLPITTSVDVPTFGSSPTNPPINPPTMEELTCTLTSPVTTAPAGSLVMLTWTSNADSAIIDNNHIANYLLKLLYQIEPVKGGTKGFPLSSEAKENNIYTFHFIKGNQTKDCTVEIMTEKRDASSFF